MTRALPDLMTLLSDLVAIPGPPGQEERIRDYVEKAVQAIGCATRVDPRGNLLISAPGLASVPHRADVVVMAHLDEIAMQVQQIDYDGCLRVVPMGGLFPWKCGEGPVLIMPVGEGASDLTGILSFGSIHTSSPASVITRARESALTWDMVRVFTGLSPAELNARNVRPGTRVVIHPSRRTLTRFGHHVASPFLDDRADLAAMLATLQLLAEDGRDFSHIVFAATAAEEVGGHGALYMLRRLQPEVGIALEIGPSVPESDFMPDSQPTVWVTDSYSAMRASDSGLLAEAAEEAGFDVHWQALTRGGSDASCAASHGLLARPITLAFAAENSHGYEIMHEDAVPNLARFLTAVLDRVP